ncbi:MAG: hypothetical protein N2D54_09615, partial [Chloroflexota bacterium]
KWDGSDMTFMVDWTHSDAVNPGPNRSNRIGVRVKGNYITVYINGDEVASIEDSTYVGDYRFGLLVGAADTEPFTVKFDNLAYWTLP